jgi:hypothetical protein
VLPEDFKVEFLSEGETAKNQLLAESKAIVAIPNPKERDATIELASSIAAHIKAVEESRKAVKEPFYKTGQKIDELARKHVADLEAEKKRLDRLVGAFEQKRLDEIRQQQAALEAEQAAREQAAETATTKKARLAAAFDAEEGREQTDEDKMALAEQARATAATGGMKRTEMEVEVFDILALYKARPDCVQPLKPDLTQIKYLHARGVELPGVRITETPIYSAKAK